MLRPVRLLHVVPAALAAALCLPAAAQAAELFAAPGGGPAPAACTTPGAPCSLAAALLAARGSAGADVVNLAPGTFAEVIAATGESDTDVTLRGAGTGATILSAPAADAPMIQLGAVGSGTMAIENLTIDGTPASTTSAALRSRLAKLTLTRVKVVQSGASTKLAPAIDADASTSELVLDQVEVVANTQVAGEPAIGAVNVGGALTMRDSTVTHTSVGDSAAVYARGNVTILRSTVSHGDANLGQALRFVNRLELKTIVLDSSVFTGGTNGVRLDVGALATTATLRGVTIMPFATGTAYSVYVDANVGGSLARTTVSSSLLGRSWRHNNGAQLSCTYTNLPTTGQSGSPNVCPATGAPATTAGNTGLTTAALKLGSDLQPAADSPAIDSGDPAGVATGESPSDRLGRTRAGASADTCDAGPGRRDKGAFERYRPSPAVAITGPDSFAAGAAQTFGAAVTARDPAYAWSFGDGASGGDGASTSHAFALGASTVKLTVTDRAWNCAASATKNVTATTPPPAAGASNDKTAPKLTKVALAKKSIKRGKNATLAFTLSEAATITVTIGRVKGKKLVATRTATFKGKKGVNRVTLSAKKLKLRRARYGLRVSARDAAGNRATTVSLKLRVR